MLTDVANYGFKIVATKPELEITFKRHEIAIPKAAFKFTTMADFELPPRTPADIGRR